MSLVAALLGAAERYMDLGIPIVPVGCTDPETPGRPGKQALTRWRKPPEPGEVLDVIAGDPRCTGVAGVMGPTTNLVCRDWDDPDAWHAWRERNPAAARSAPLVGSARAGHAYTIGAGVRSRTLPDGELRARGCYVLMPPSLAVDPAPGAPRQYRWVNPLPRSLDLIPRVDIRIFVPDGTDAGSEGGAGDGPPAPPNTLCVPPIVGIDIAECIRRTLPTGPGQRHHRLWELARWLRAILPGDTTEAALRDIAREWYRQALPVIRTKDLRVTQHRLVEAWRDVKAPAGCDWSLIVAAADADDWRPRLGGSADRIARVLRAAGQAHGWGDFPADYRHLAQASGVTPRGAHKAADVIERAGYVVRVDRGKAGRRTKQATIWRWMGPRP